MTHAIPVAHGYVISSCIKHIPIAGSDITKFIQKVLVDRKVQVPREDLQDVSRQIKEKYCYIAKNYGSEFSKYKGDSSGTKLKKFIYNNSRNGQNVEIKIKQERFSAPEIFFNPSLITNEWKQSLDEIIDQSIQKCPIDNRKALYQNILLSGGTTMFRNFSKRLQSAIKQRVDERKTASAIDVNVVKLKT